MKLSIIICSYNRASALKLVFNDLESQIKNQNDMELILVDNNSKDETKNLPDLYPELKIKYLLESNQGLSFARNSGIRAAQGDLIIFIDDDIRLEANWLEETYKLAQNTKSDDLVAYGAKVIPQWQSTLPKWLKLEGKYAITQSVFPGHDYGEDIKSYPFTYKGFNVQNPLGACIAFSKKIFEKFGYFREDLGVGVGGGFYLHEDTEFMRYLGNHQVAIKYLPQIIVYHPVPESRMSKKYIREWYMKSAFSFYYLAHSPRANYYPDAKLSTNFPGIPEKFKKFLPQALQDIEIFDIPIYLILKYIGLIVIYPILLLKLDSSLIFYHSIALAKTKGEIKAAKFLS